MPTKPSLLILIGILLWSSSLVVQGREKDECRDDSRPAMTFIEFQSLNIEQQPPTPLTVKGKLQLPVHSNSKQPDRASTRKLPAVIILHGSAGVDFRGNFYARALNAAGIATLEIDMWEARGITSGKDRPPLPLYTYPDAFAALAFLATHDIIDPDRIGVLGFSWGGVIAMASAEELYAKRFGGDLRFAAHVAHYPVCYAYNNPDMLPGKQSPKEAGTQFLNLTGKPLLIQIGTEDDYDNGADHCYALVDDLVDPKDKSMIEIVAYKNAYHGWDRLQVPMTVPDPYANEGSSFFATGQVPMVVIAPDVDQAYASREKAVQFFLGNL